MMKVTYRLKVGQDEFELTSDIADERQFFEKMSFYASLPKTAPGGATDLRLSFRTTTKGYKYYSLVSDSEGVEFAFGQENSASGGLFPKGWQPVFNGQSGEGQEAPQVEQAPVQKRAPPVAAPNPAVTKAAPVASRPASLPPTPSNPAPSAPTPQNTQPSVSPQVTAVAGNVLARFGINK